MIKSIDKKPGRSFIIAGWILNVIAALSLLGSCRYVPHTRDIIIQDLIYYPSGANLLYATAYIIGCNMFSFPALIFGLYARIRHKYRSGTYVIIVASLIIIGVSVRAVMPTSKYHKTDIPSDSYIAAHDQCEYTVLFPHNTTSREGVVAGIRSYLVESTQDANPQLRAEFIPLKNTAAIEADYENVITDFSYRAGIEIPEITVEDTDMGKKGTYSGIKIIGEYRIKLYGITYLGDSSMIHCMVLEPLQTFPSQESIIFLESIRKN